MVAISRQHLIGLMVTVHWSTSATTCARAHGVCGTETREALSVSSAASDLRVDKVDAMKNPPPNYRGRIFLWYEKTCARKDAKTQRRKTKWEMGTPPVDANAGQCKSRR